jgi:hypothetical protein
MNRWRAEYDDGIWRFYRDGMELGLYEKGDVVIDALNNAESRIAELEAESERFTVHSDIERQDDKSPNDTQTQTIVYGKESEE